MFLYCKLEEDSSGNLIYIGIIGLRLVFAPPSEAGGGANMFLVGAGVAGPPPKTSGDYGKSIKKSTNKHYNTSV